MKICALDYKFEIYRMVLARKINRNSLSTTPKRTFFSFIFIHNFNPKIPSQYNQTIVNYFLNKNSNKMLLPYQGIVLLETLEKFLCRKFLLNKEIVGLILFSGGFKGVPGGHWPRPRANDSRKGPHT